LKKKKRKIKKKRRSKMKYLEYKNKHERDELLYFDEKKHEYNFYDIRFEPRLMYPAISSTTLIHSLFPKFNADEIIDSMMESSSWERNKYYPMTKDQIKETWSNNSKDAMIKGTQLHEDIESYLNFECVSNSTIEFQFFLNFIRDNKLNVYRTEWKIFDEESAVAGTIDCCCLNSYGEMIIYDWKRSKEIKRTNDFKKKYSTKNYLKHLEDVNFSQYSLQLNLYKYILEKNYGCKVKDLYLVVLHPENSNNNYKIVYVPDMSKEIKDIIDERICNKNK
jgi:ATP-dependent exoDNAse (exonuclease V) beta subunit